MGAATRLHVSGLPRELLDDDLRARFTPFGAGVEPGGVQGEGKFPIPHGPVRCASRTLVPGPRRARRARGQGRQG